MKLVPSQEKWSEGAGLLCAGLLLGACWLLLRALRLPGCSFGTFLLPWLRAEWFCTKMAEAIGLPVPAPAGDGAATGRGG